MAGGFYTPKNLKFKRLFGGQTAVLPSILPCKIRFMVFTLICAIRFTIIETDQEIGEKIQNKEKDSRVFTVFPKLFGVLYCGTEKP